jgi:hypothetical protein
MLLNTYGILYKIYEKKELKDNKEDKNNGTDHVIMINISIGL